jgi:hypothetical protein
MNPSFVEVHKYRSNLETTKVEKESFVPGVVLDLNPEARFPGINRNVTALDIVVGSDARRRRQPSGTLCALSCFLTILWHFATSYHLHSSYSKGDD